MDALIQVSGLTKSIGNKEILRGIDFKAGQGEIIGVVGINGAGKTTFLKSLLGLTDYEGEIKVCGLEPRKNQPQLTRDVSFIADTATLPKWITAEQLLEYMDGVHPNFHLEKAQAFLANTKVEPKQKVKSMSKGMVTQLHLALVSAIQSKLLVLDEPTLGLDIIRRKKFYRQLLEDYFDQNNSVVITTHQVEEIEQLLTRVVFIDDGRVLLDRTMDALQSEFCELLLPKGTELPELGVQAIYEEPRFDCCRYIFQGVSEELKERLSQLGSLFSPSLSDIFIALTESQDYSDELGSVVNG